MRERCVGGGLIAVGGWVRWHGNGWNCETDLIKLCNRRHGEDELYLDLLGKRVV